MDQGSTSISNRRLLYTLGPKRVLLPPGSVTAQGVATNKRLSLLSSHSDNAELDRSKVVLAGQNVIKGLFPPGDSEESSPMPGPPPSLPELGELMAWLI
ncbi:Hypothetical protein FKW44_021000 [Caligus rogercresseyi]|uniref:Uncharacterized protein n=1 Tax=Caligus rogercresseyi TaxID=217165 RepID=A0A7T8JUU3_CALRO|nr:Hypothetical protein FKW44_021000 [Caligus rogercresseyi]